MDTEIDSAAIARSATLKASWRILPLLGLGYLMSYMDRVNVSFAAAQMNADLGFSATVYGFGSGIFFLSYALLEVPSGMAVTRVGARRWIARIMISWGLLAAGMMFVRTPTQFYIMRFLLGAAEAGYFPCAVYCVSQWFPPAHRGRATSIFYCFSGVSSIVMGLVSGWLLAMNGAADLRGWQWLFLVEGLPAFFLGIVILFCLPDDPARARWLTPAERDWIETEQLREAERLGVPQDHELLAALRNPRVLQLAVLGFLTIGTYVGFQLFLPQLLAAGTGFDAKHVGYLTSLGGLATMIGMILSGWHSDRLQDRLPHLIAGCMSVGVSFVAMAFAPNVGILLVAYYAVSLFWPLVTLSTLVLCSELVPRRTVGVAIATVNTLSQIGAFLGPWLIGVSKDATGSYHLGQMALPVGFFLSVAIALNLRRKAAPSTRPLPAV
ncbi:MAG: MFS transporter [Sphingobium sp.]|nr:MFS transporter [Sphingobium sp.]